MSEKHPKTAYAITTVILKPGVEAELDAAVRGAIPLLEARGVRLALAWTPMLGQYGKVVGIWEAASHADFLTAFSDPAVAACGEHLEALGTVTVELATMLVQPTRTLSAEERRGGVIASGNITLHPGKASHFVRIVEDAAAKMARHGAILLGSYHTLVGDRTRVLDVFWAPGATEAYTAVADPYWETQAVDLDWPGTMVGEHIDVSTELVFG